MAIPAAVGSSWQVVIEGRQEGQLTANVMHFSCVGASADVDLHLIQVLLSCFITHLLPVLTSKWTLERVRWKQVAPAVGIEQISIPAGGPAAGGGAATALPSFCSAVLSKRTLFAGRVDVAGCLSLGYLRVKLPILQSIRVDHCGRDCLPSRFVLSMRLFILIRRAGATCLT